MTLWFGRCARCKRDLTEAQARVGAYYCDECNAVVTAEREEHERREKTERIAAEEAALGGRPGVYIVAGTTGEYSDTKVWYVRAFLDRAGAEEFSAGLNAWCRERGLYEGGWRRYDSPPPKPPSDPDFKSDSTGTQYEVIVVPLHAAPLIPLPTRGRP